MIASGQRGPSMAAGLLAAFLAGGAARADVAPAPASPGCPDGNLLQGRRPVMASDVHGNLALPTDGEVAPEGALWNSTPAMIFDTPAGSLTYDLGATVALQAIYIQADANDTYGIFGSIDGATFTRLADVPTAENHGLRSRNVALHGDVVRYLRVGEGEGDGFYSLSEVQAFCRIPSPFPPALKVVDAPAQPAPAAGRFAWWNNESSARWELVLAILGLALLAWELWLARAGLGDRFRSVQAFLLATLGLVSAGTYVNFGFFHFNNFIHNWDTFHYYVGAKYFRELSYDRLYECVAIADWEAGLKRRVELRKVTNLRTNVLEHTGGILAHPEACKDHFSPERWESFKHDVAWFRGRVNTKNWEDAQTDHGFNGTPVWSIAGSFLANTGPVSERQIKILDSIDLGYMLAMAALLWWAFGWRALCVALLVYATNFPSRWYWTGGSLLRYDWLFYTVASVCLMKKERPFLAGLSLVYAALLRIFPAFLMAGPLALAVRQAWRAEGGAAAGLRGRLALVDRRLLHLFGGAAVGLVCLGSVSVVTAGGPHAYVRFVQNTSKHAGTPLTNYMGLKTVLAYRPSEVGRNLRSNNLTDPWSVWKEARRRAFKQAIPAYLVLIGGFLALLTLAVRKAEPWMALSMGAMTIPVGAELTCYYYAFLVVVAALTVKRREVGVALTALTAATQFIAWAPQFPAWTHLPAMSTWLDEQYTVMSVATLAVFVYILWIFAFPAAEPADGEAKPRR